MYICAFCSRIMRLGQLARQLSIRPEVIVNYLATQNIAVEGGNNTRLQPEQVSLALQRFAPNNQELQQEIILQPDQQEDEVPVISENPIGLPEIPEVIKAPKVELPGLRVLGKIDLPEKKKPAAPTEEQAPPSLEQRPTYQPRRDHRPKPRKNPIAQAREREELDRKERLAKEREAEKQRRTEYYQKRLKPQQPTRAARIFNEETIEMPPLERERPKTWWGRFMRWLNT